MGSSGWYYFAPYQEDLAAVLAQVRNHTFATGAYYHPLTWYKGYVNSPAFLAAPLDEQKGIRRRLKVLESQGLPSTIEALIEKNAESGTHSILDIDHIADETEFNAVAPLPIEVLQELFGTEKPTRLLVEEQLHVLQGFRFRWCGTYIIYERGQPAEVCFVGNSGD